MVWLSLIWLGLRLLVGGLLVLAGSLKLSTHNGRRWLEPYQLLPAWMLPIAATTIAVAELVAGAALLLGAFGALSAVGAAALLLLVTSAAAITLLRGKRPPCGCFGGLSNELLSWRIVVRNVVFVGLMLLCAAVVGSTPLNLNLAPLTEVIVVVAVAIGFAVGLPRLFNPRRISAPVGLPREAIH
jgi:uncharacterized membrane protein YphA (DoxX/SURF4 family)